MIYEEYPLKRNSRERIFNNLIFFDTETYIAEENEKYQIHKLRLGIAQYYRLDTKKELQDEIIFRSGKEFAEWIVSKTRKNSSLYVFAHNIAFDFAICGLAKYLPQFGYDLIHVFLEDNCVCLEYKKGSTKIIFLDTFNYIRLPVREIGKAIGLKKLEIDIFNASDEVLIEYCRRDVEIIARFMIEYLKFFKDEGLGEFGVTTAKNAFNAFTHKFLKEDIVIHRHKDVIELERNAYFGGRNEAFFIGSIKEPIWYLDINSMYPHVMKAFKYPVRLIRYVEDYDDFERLKKIIDTYCVIAEVQLDTDENAYPYRLKDKTIFPTGTFTTYLCTPELKYALECGHVKKVNKMAIYLARNIFSDFVDYFYSKRKEAKKKGDSVRSFLYKLILNSLYGKFGQTIRMVSLYDEIEDFRFGIEEYYNEDGKKEYDLIFIGNKVFKKVKEKEPSRWAYIAISAHVTSYARFLLWTYMKKAQLENVYYVDTDSLFVNEKGFKNLQDCIDQYELGKLSIEAEGNNVKIHGAKDYEFDGKVKLKGIKKNAQKLDEKRYLQLQFPSINRVIRDEMIEFVKVTKQIKELKRIYEKGIVTASGRVKPYYLQDNQLVPEKS